MKIGDLVCDIFDNRSIYKIEKFEYSDWSKQTVVSVTIIYNRLGLNGSRKYYLQDLRFANEDEISRAIEKKLLS